MDPKDDFEDQTTMVHDVPIPASLRRAKKPFVLEQVGGPGAPREFLLEQDEIIVGRSLQANISIDGNGISRQHAAIRRAGPEYTFVDLNSANGVYLNTVKTHSAVLRQGDTLQLGDALFVFHEGA
ncbi:MAG TPA: FHA domain-containing protein [Polyangiaceae bacterium]